MRSTRLRGQVEERRAIVEVDARLHAGTAKRRELDGRRPPIGTQGGLLSDTLVELFKHNLSSSQESELVSSALTRSLLFMKRRDYLL